MSLATVGDSLLNLSHFAWLERAERQAARVQVEAWSLHLHGRQTRDEIVQSDVGVGLCLCILCRAHQVHATNGGKELREAPLTQDVTSVFPFVLATLHKLVEIAAATAGREDKFVRKGSIRRPARPRCEMQGRPVEVAIRRIVGVGTMTSRADNG